MPIFEYPYIIITIFVFFFLVLAAVGIYFAVRGVRTAGDAVEREFSTISKIETDFQKFTKQHETRCLTHIHLSPENLHSLFPHAVATNIMAKIQAVLLQTFAGNNGTVAPCGDYHFVALNACTAIEAEQYIEQCRTALNQCLLKQKALNIATVYFGLYVATGSSIAFDEALNRAKQASTLAQKENKPCIEWNQHNGKALEQKINIENNIEQQIDANRFFLEYQPIIDAHTRRIIGAEVLSRLNSETDGVLTPHRFLSAVSSVGVNEKFDYYIFEKNCKWISNDPTRKQYLYTINFSRSTLCDPAFATTILGLAEQYNVPLSCLAIEILEDKAITGEARAQMMQNVSTLKQQGLSILLDDFGSGYTAFHDLQHLDISIVKIDKTLVHSAVTETGWIILKNIIRTANDIGFKTLCEGIETAEQEQAVTKAGCDFLQGFLYYKPMPVAQLEQLFDTNA